VGALRDQLQRGLLEEIPGVVVHGDPSHRLSNTLNIGISGVSGEAVLMNLDLAGIAVGLGAACESGSVEPSHVLLALGLSGEEAMAGLRFSLSRYNTAAEVEEALGIIPRVVERIRGN
jgi:cysteine desulfurase